MKEIHSEYLIIEANSIEELQNKVTKVLDNLEYQVLGGPIVCPVFPGTFQMVFLQALVKPGFVSS